MARAIKKLTARTVETLTKPGLYGDGLGLWLQIAVGGSKSWIFRYKFKGRPRRMGLGPTHTVGLAEARDRAQAARRLLLDGRDPIEARREARANQEAVTFKDCAERYIAAHRSGWRNVKHAEQWGASLERYVYPVFGDRPVSAVDVHDVLKVVEPIWPTRTETASRVRGRIENILDWAAVRGLRSGVNPARWRGHLAKLLPPKGRVAKVQHFPALAYQELPDFIVELHRHEGITPVALEFTILTAARTGEVVRAHWSEIDIDAGLWTVPAQRTKSEREHRVPLSHRALAILTALPRETKNKHVFLGARKGAGLSNMGMLELLRGMKGHGLTVHGFRSSFRDWAAEQTNFPAEVAEMALGHVVKDRVEAAYRRGDMFERRRKLMEQWARYCGTPSGSAGKVVTLKGRG